MGKVKSYFVSGNFVCNSIEIRFSGKVSAVSHSQAHYYCCQEIRNDLAINLFIEIYDFQCIGISSDLWSQYGNLEYGLKYTAIILDKFIIEDLNEIRKVVKPGDIKENHNDPFGDPAF